MYLTKRFALCWEPIQRSVRRTEEIDVMVQMQYDKRSQPVTLIGTLIPFLPVLLLVVWVAFRSVG